MLYLYDMNGKTIGQKIKEIRLANHLTQIDVEEKAELYPHYLSQLENGYKQPRIQTLKRIAAALGVSMMQLIEVDDEPVTVQTVQNFIIIGDKRFNKGTTVYKAAECMAELNKTQQETVLALVQALYCTGHTNDMPRLKTA